jgi:hypothetical protein
MELGESLGSRGGFGRSETLRDERRPELPPLVAHVALLGRKFTSLKVSKRVAARR